MRVALFADEGKSVVWPITNQILNNLHTISHTCYTESSVTISNTCTLSTAVLSLGRIGHWTGGPGAGLDT